MVKHTSLLPSLTCTVALLGLVGCDVGDEEFTPETETSLSEGGSAKVAPEIAAEVFAGRAPSALVVFADRPERFRRQFARTILPQDDFEAYLQGEKSRFDEIKAGVVALASGGIEPLRVYDNLPVMHVRLTSSAALQALADHEDVVAVFEDRVNQAFVDPPNLGLIGQPKVAAAGKLGAGSAVAVLDTGTDYTRAPFNCTAPGSPASCPVVYAQDFATQDNARDTGSFHGTNVAGIVLAVAPAAKIIALDVFDGNGAYTSVILAAINWVVQNRAKYNIVAINMSLGGGLYTSTCVQDPFAAGIAAARSAGVLSAIASGNNGSWNSMASPACVPSAVSVGAVYPANVGTLRTSICSDLATSADKVACFSNSASFLTILAPGVGITAAGITMSGTSQATPHVAGAIALLASAFPTAKPDALVAKLITSQTKVTDARNRVSTPRLDLPSALGGGAAAAPAPVPAPSGKVVINSGAAYTNSTTVTVNVATSSGTAAKVCLSSTTTCTAWSAYATTKSFPLPAGDGRKTVYVWWQDGKGNASTAPQSASITLDTKAPSNGLVVHLLTGNVDTLKWSGFADVGSGIASYRLVSSTSGVPANCTVGTSRYSGSATTYRFTGLPTGTTYMRLCAVDAAGNMSAGVTNSISVAAATRR